jgi:dipeptidyl aminopeptidase/acylaminoacyl peptidase
MPITRLMFCVLLLASSLFAQTTGFTLEQVLSSPFPTGLTAAAKTNRIAWVFNSKGERNVWIADAPAFEGRQVTHYQGDDGQDIFSPKLTPDGKSVVYARGSEVNREGFVANPAHELQAPRQQVWAADIETGQPRLLGDMGCDEEDCEDIQLSPDGHWAVWVGAKHHLFIAPIGGGKPARQLTSLRGNESQQQWSPDGKHIVFTSDRGVHSFVVILDISGEGALESFHYIAPSADRDMAAQWSPEGKQIVFIRTGGTEQHLPMIPLRPQPWAIWLADASTATAKELWHSGTAMNDSLPPFAAESLKFGEGGVVVFCSEKDGRNRLYSIHISGGVPRELSGVDADVEDVELTSDKREVFYTSNQGDVDRRHIWAATLQDPRLPVKIDTRVQVTSGQTIEWHPIALADGTSVVCFGSTATSPAMPYFLAPRDAKAIVPAIRKMIAASALPKDFPSAQLVEPQQVVFKSDDGLEIHGQLFVPRSRPAKPGPALIFVHGGPPRQMMLGFHYMYYYHNAYAQNQYLASLGYVVLSVNYRRGVMYGRAFREPANAGWRGSSEYKDVVAGAKYLQSLNYVDRNRIGIWGGSYGGLLTALGLARNSDIFSAGVDFHGVHDWSTLLGDSASGMAQPPDFKEALKLAFDSSPAASVSQWKSPVLLIHGDDDRNVPFAQTTDLVQRLRKQNVHFEELILPDEIHDFLLWKSWVNGYRATAEFFDRQLRSK